jgi:hypothetical protein
MKSKTVLILVFAIIACNSKRSSKSLSVQGIYVTTYKSEYSTAMDTIDIAPLNNEAGTFSYVRRVGFRRISNGVLEPMEYKTEVSTCLFNENTAQLNEQRHGRTYSLSSDGN